MNSWLAVLFLAGVVPGHAALTLVSSSAMATAFLDLDGDGLAEVSAFQQSGSEMVAEIRVDGVGTPIQFPDDGFVGVNLRRFASSSSLFASSIFSGDFTAQSNLTRLYDNIQGYSFLFASEPILAGWIYGTSGSGAADVHLIGMVIDATDFFSSGGAADLKVYHHDFGAFSPGESLANASLAATSFPPTRDPLPSVAEIDGPRRGRIEVQTTIGKSYRLMRGTRPRTGSVIDTRAGTGEVETFSWNDASSTDSQAYFWVEEIPN